MDSYLLNVSNISVSPVETKAVPMESFQLNVSDVTLTKTKIKPMDSNLFNAAVKGRIKPFKKIQQHLKDMVNESKDTILHVHINRSPKSSSKFVEGILHICPELLLQVNDRGNTPLHLAAVYDEYDVVQVLLTSARDQAQAQVLYISKKDVAKIMLKMTNSYGKTTFDVAMENESIEVLKILIREADNDVFNFANNIGKLVIFAATIGNPEILDEIKNNNRGQALLLQELRRHDDSGTQPKDTILLSHINTSSWRKSTTFVKKILDIYPPILLQANAEGDTPLHAAAQCGKPEIVKVLLEHARDQSQDSENAEIAITEMLIAKNKKEQTAFDLAVEKGNIEVVNILIKEAKSDVFDFANSISKILALAAKVGHHEILDSISIHEKGRAALFQELSKYDNPGMQDTILHSHIESYGRQSTEFVKKILNFRLSSLPFKCNAKGDTPIHVAAECNKSEIAEFLLTRVREDPERGESAIIEMLNKKNNAEKTAFDLAVQNGSIEVLKVLVEAAEPDFFNFSGAIGEILDDAARRGDHEILEEIAKGRDGETALIQELKKHEIPGTQPNDTILHTNIKWNSSSKFVEYIVGKNSSLLLQINANKDTPLHVAAEWGQNDIVEILLKCAKEPHQSQGQTRETAIRKMLKMKNSDEKTAFDVAVESESIEVLRILVKEAGPDFFNFANVIGKILNLAVDSKDHETLNEIAKGLEGKRALIQELSKYNIPGTHPKKTILHTHIKSVRGPSKDIVETLLRLCPSLHLQVDDNSDTPIHVAVKCAEFDIVEVLLEHAKRKTQEQNGEQRSNGNKVQYEMMKVLKCARDQSQEKKPEWKKIWEMKNNEGKTILDIAVENCEARVVTSLIAAPELSDFHKNFRKRILYFAARRGDYETAASVAESRQNEKVLDGPVVDSNIPEDKQSNDTILHVHIQYSKEPSQDFMTKILDKCPSLLVKVNEKGDTPLHVAAKCGRYGTVEFLLQRAKDKPQDLEIGVRTYWEMKSSGGNKANRQALKMKNSEGNKTDDWRQMLRIPNDEGNTALHEAVRHGKFEVVKMLIRRDRSVQYSANNAGETPLYLAATRGYYRMVREIFRSFESAADEGPNGMTALHAAVMNFDISGSKSAASGNPNGMTNFADSDFDDSDSDDSDYEDSGAFSSLDIMEEIIMRRKSLTKAQDEYGWTPLHYAAYYGLDEKVDLLLRFDKSAAYIVDKNRKMTALHVAAGQGHVGIIKKIIHRCVQCCEITDYRGWNVLHFAMLSLSKEELVDLQRNPLLRSLINRPDCDGNTPLHIRAAAYRDSFFHGGDRQIANQQNVSVSYILKHGSFKLEEEIEELFEDVADGQCPKGVIRENTDEHCSTFRSERRKKYYDGLKETRSSQLLVATLIATVTFTAAFTIPGGYNNDKGSDEGTAILNKNLAFQIFIITDTIAMTLALSAVFVHFIMSFEKFQKFENLFTLASCLTMLAMGAVVFAFVTGIYAVLSPSLWLAITTCALGLSFFLLVLCTLKLIRWSTLPEWLHPIGNCLNVKEWWKQLLGVISTHFKKRN